MPSPFPCSPLIRECLWYKTHMEKKHVNDNVNTCKWQCAIHYLKAGQKYIPLAQINFLLSQYLDANVP